VSCSLKLDLSSKFDFLLRIWYYRGNERFSGGIEKKSGKSASMPKSFPRASAALLERFKEEHLALFKRGDLWSLDIHRKKLIDWLPRNGGVL